MDDAHSALLIISIIIVLFVNFSIHSFNSALRELDNSDIEEEGKEGKKEDRLRRFLEKKDKVLYCTHIVNILSVSFLGWYFVRTFGSIIKNKLPNTLPVSFSSGLLYSLCYFRNIIAKQACKKRTEKKCIYIYEYICRTDVFIVTDYMYN